MRRNSCRKQILPILAAAAFLCATITPALAQRSYQRYWIEQYREQPPIVVIEDENPPLDLLEEFRLFDDRLEQHHMTAFPGHGTPPANEADNAALRSYVQGAITAETGSPAEALRHYRDAMERNPESEWLKMRVIKAALQVNDLSQAEVLLDELLDTNPQNYQALFYKGELTTVRRRYNESKEWYHKVLEVRSGNIAALERLAQISHEIDRDYEKTKEYADRILAVNDRHMHAILWSAEAAALTGDIERASELYSRGIRFSPGLVQRMAEVARQLIIRGRVADALVLYETAMGIMPGQDAIRTQWEDLVKQVHGEDALREAYRQLYEETRDTRIADLYAEYLRRAGDWQALEQLRLTVLQRSPEHAPSLMDLARIYQERGETDTANDYLELAELSNPADPLILREIGIARMRHGDTEGARKYLERALAISEDDTETLDSLALLEQYEGNYQRAEELLRKALNSAPVDRYLLKRLGGLYIAMDERSKAKDVLQQVLVSNEFDSDAWLTLAEIHLADRESTALDELEQRSRRMLRSIPDVMVNYGILAQGYGDHERSRRVLERALENVPENLRARAALSRTYLLLGMHEKALQVMDEGSEHVAAGDRARHQRFLASLHGDLHQYAKAENIWRSLVEDTPGDIELHSALIEVLLAQGKRNQATEVLNDAVRQFKLEQPAETELLRARAYQRMDEPHRALSILKRLEDDAPDNRDVWFQIAIAAADTGDIAMARQYYQRLIDAGLPPANAYFVTASNNLGYLLAERGEDLETAEKLVRQALDLDPTAGYILDSMGWVYFKMGELERAKKYLERAAEVSYRDAEIYLHLGELYEKMGEKERARAMYDKALEADPDMQGARERRDALMAGDTQQPAL